MIYDKSYNGTASIMLEDYSAMEGLMKEFLLLAPALSPVLYQNLDFATFQKFQRFQQKVVDHLES